MDSSGKTEGRSRWQWLPAMMPRVAQLMAERRRELGAEHVALCWQRGVLEQLPGWFYAREGAIAVGAPFVGDPEFDEDKLPRYTPGQAVLVLRQPGAPA